MKKQFLNYNEPEGKEIEEEEPVNLIPDEGPDVK